MGQLFYFLFSTGGAIVLLAVSAIWLWRRPDSAPARRMVFGVALLYTMASIYVVPAAIVQLATRGYQRFDGTAAPTRERVAVVLLGAGSQKIVGWDGSVSIPTPLQAARILEAWRVFQKIEPTWIISSGGSSESQVQSPAGVMRDELVRLGVPPDRIVLEDESRNTWDEAVVVSRMMRSLDVNRLVLVTSDIHMPRALGAFRAQGMTAVPAIAPDPGRAGTRFDRYVPNATSLALSGLVVHELLGIAYYWSRGWWQP